MFQTLYKGIVVGMASPYEALVYISARLTPASGQLHALGENAGSTQKTSELIGSSVKCRMMTPLTSGAWWSYVPELDSSVPTSESKINSSDVLDFKKFPHAKTTKTTFSTNIQTKASNPRDSLSAVNPIPNQSGGIPIPAAANVPPGTFPTLKPNQHVLVGFVSCSTPIILGTLPTDKEFLATIG